MKHCRLVTTCMGKNRKLSFDDSYNVAKLVLEDTTL